ncbi:MFS transporter [Arsenicicoccus sp. oral taxon 190]|uniref:MFS transporter n=1 Tax=Arsenicicoccus sp. oral taxon 190 TaxID=1658671 RepID=UPI00067A0BA8|nr:MFS transporter [Arsenicicoccus sp. oral taxon 190]AKT50744.1 MFS transporter [Arsenicicoccus sp. oral taxon 190]
MGPSTHGVDPVHDEVEPGLLKRAIAASAIGNAVEWFDYGIYAYGTAFIAKALFPADAANAMIFTLGGFAISFVMRPLGGLIWGPLGDKIGRKAVLATTITLMAAATVLVGLIPSYGTIGIAAPVVLYLLRMVQGFSAGGEYGGAATFMAEYAPDRRRGFLGSFLEFGTLAGFNLGALLMLGLIELTSAQQMESWGWRIPFLIAGPLGMVGIYLRSKMEDTPVFRELEAAEEHQHSHRGMVDTIKVLFAHHIGSMLKLMGLVLALNVVNYTLLSYTPTYLQGLAFTPTQALLVPIFGQLLMMVFLPLAGTISDRWGRKPSWLMSLLGIAVLALPCYKLMQTGFAGAIAGFAILGLAYIPQLATISATFPAMFPTHVRYAGVALGYNISTALFGGTAGLVNEWLIKRTGDEQWPAYYMIAACLIGLVALFFTVETKGVSLRGTHTPGTEEALAEQRAASAGHGGAAPA